MICPETRQPYRSLSHLQNHYTIQNNYPIQNTCCALPVRMHLHRITLGRERPERPEARRLVTYEHLFLDA